MKRLFACLTLLLSQLGFANEVEKGLKNLEITNSIGGLIQIDYSDYDKLWNNDLFDASDISLRRIRLNTKGKIGSDLSYKLEVNFNENGDIKVEDAFINYRKSNSNIYIGQVLEPLGLEGITSPKWNTAIELSPISSVISPGRSTGLTYRGNFDKTMIHLGVYDNGRQKKTQINDQGEETIGKAKNNFAYTGRFTFVPYQSENTFLHFGAAYSHRETENTNLSISSSGAIRGDSPVFAKALTTANDVEIVGLEAAFIANNFSIQGEHFTLDVDERSSVDKLDVDGWYLLTSYFITGETRNYYPKTGDFGSIKPNSKHGAIEVFGRHSEVTFDSAHSVDLDSTTLGVNYYVNQDMKVSFNAVKLDRESAGDLASGYAYHLRFQLVY